MSDSSKVRAINLPERQLTTSQQVNTLLGVCGMFWSVLHSGAPDPETESPRLRGEPRLAAESTFIKACAALQQVLDDPRRWDFEYQNTIEADYKESIELNKDYLRAQKAHAEEMASPHFRLQPSLLKLTDNTWMAILGDINNIEHAIIGVGANPKEAFESFDKSFSGETSESVIKFIQTHTHEIPEVDNGTNRQIEDPQSGREDNPGNSPHPET